MVQELSLQVDCVTKTPNKDLRFERQVQFEKELIRRNHSSTTSLTGRFGELQRAGAWRPRALTSKDVDERRGADTTNPSGCKAQGCD